MIRDTGAGLAFARSWSSGRADVVTREVELDRGDRRVPATLVQPARGAAGAGRGRRGKAAPGWILLHGATVPGREHAQLVRFARSVAHTGATVLVPEVPEWKALRLAPARTVPTVRAAVPTLQRLSGGPVGLIGFSFGAPHAVLAGAEPDLARELRAIVGFGGYCELPSTLHYLFLGEHEWRGQRHRLRPDPYGRWIVAGNYLPCVAGYPDADAVAGALLALAADAGLVGLPSGDPAYDERKRELAAGLGPQARELFELIAPPRDEIPPDRAAVEQLLERLAPAIQRADPLMDPAARLRDVRVPVRLVHGHGDVLIPYTETLRMAERLDGVTDVRVTITRLFAHSQDEPIPAGLRLVAEQARFVRAVGRVLRMW